MKEKEVKAVATTAQVHERTVYRWLKDRGRCTESVQNRIEAAIRKLKIKVKS